MEGALMMTAILALFVGIFTLYDQIAQRRDQKIHKQ